MDFADPGQNKIKPCAHTMNTILKHLFFGVCGSISYVDQEDGDKMSGMSIALLSGADERTGGV